MGMLLDGVLSAQTMDSSAEIVDIEGADISDFNSGKAYINFEHRNDSPEDIIGIFKFATKIFKESDCKTERQKKFWKSVGEVPYIYVIGELFDDQDHAGAVAAAAMVNFFKKNNQKVKIGFSTEGLTLDRDGNNLKWTVMRRAAFTLRPCLAVADMDNISEKEAKDAESKLSKREVEISSSDLVISIDDFNDANFSDIKQAIDELNKTLADNGLDMLSLSKTLTAGSYNVAPSQLTSGSALQTENISDIKDERRKKIKELYAKWDRKRPLKEVIKAALPEVSDEYINTFEDLAEDLALKKNLPKVKLERIGKEHGHFSHDDDQKTLIDGLYLIPSHEPAPQLDVPHENWSSPVYRLKNDAGHDVVVKKPSVDKNDEFSFGDQAHNSKAYYRAAKDFFGMGDHVPKTAIFSHPKLSEGSWQAMEMLNGAKTPIEMSKKDIENHMNKHFKDGTIHKLMVMDHVLGHADRHSGNLMIGKDGKIFHIDNDLAFQNDAMSPEESFYHRETAYGQHPMHKNALEWVNSLDPAKLAETMLKVGVDKDKIKNSLKTLKSYQKYGNKGYPLSRVAQLAQAELGVKDAKDV